jgi:hypothetical protein
MWRGSGGGAGIECMNFVPSENARCAEHPTVDALLVCRRCGDFACLQCLEPNTANRGVCRRCHLHEDSALLWEGSGKNWLARYLHTMNLALFRPRSLFHQLSDARLGTAYLFALMNWFLYFVAGLASERRLADLIQVIWIPVMTAGYVSVLAGLIHVSCGLVGGSSAFVRTLHACCYVTGSLLLLGALVLLHTHPPIALLAFALFTAYPAFLIAQHIYRGSRYWSALIALLAPLLAFEISTTGLYLLADAI